MIANELIKSELTPSQPFPDPTTRMLASPEFKAIWDCIKDWDISVPKAYSGYCGATGNHVRAILDALSPCLQKPRSPDVICVDKMTVFITPGELRVLRSIVKGNPSSKIAIETGLSLGTIKTYVSNLLAKFECHNRAELISHVLRNKSVIIEKIRNREISQVTIES